MRRLRAIYYITTGEDACLLRRLADMPPRRYSAMPRIYARLCRDLFLATEHARISWPSHRRLRGAHGHALPPLRRLRDVILPTCAAAAGYAPPTALGGAPFLLPATHGQPLLRPFHSCDARPMLQRLRIRRRFCTLLSLWAHFIRRCALMRRRWRPATTRH